VGFVDLGVAFAILIVMMIAYGFAPSPNLVFVPLFVLLNITVALAVGIWLSALTIRFRDFKHVVPFLVQFGLYATPVGYPARLVPEQYLFIYNLNPMAGIIEGFRWSLLGGAAPGGYFYLSTGVVIFLFFSGLFYFRRVEDVMADIV
jgi:lipopolysaccharide transport system permease protein